MNYVNNIIKSVKIYAWNYMNADDNSCKISTNFSNKLYYENFDKNNNVLIDDKAMRINTLLYIKQVKNTYYKYTKKELFNQELYNTFIRDENFDGGLTAFDDDDDVPIFDKYILDYIKNRNNTITYIQCKNKNIKFVTNLEELTERDSVLFIIDMNDKDLFQYCYEFIQKTDNINMLKDIIFSIIIKYNGKYIKTNISNVKNSNKKHHFIILESLLI